MGIPFFFMFGGFGGYETALLFLLPLGVILLQNYAANNAMPQPGHGGIVGAIRRFVGRAPDGSVVGLATIGIFLAFVYLLTSCVRHRLVSQMWRAHTLEFVFKGASEYHACSYRGRAHIGLAR